MSSAVDQAAEPARRPNPRARGGALEALSERCPSLTGGARAAAAPAVHRGSVQPAAARVAVAAAAVLAPTRPVKPDQGEPRDQRRRDGEEDEDQAELPLPGAGRPPEGGPGEEVGPFLHGCVAITPPGASPSATFPAVGARYRTAGRSSGSRISVARRSLTGWYPSDPAGRAPPPLRARSATRRSRRRCARARNR